MDLEVGDKVKVRSWDSMAKKFGTDFAGDINCGFVKEMSKYCGELVTVESVLEKSSFTIKEDPCGYRFYIEEIIPEIRTHRLLHKIWEAIK